MKWTCLIAPLLLVNIAHSAQEDGKALVQRVCTKCHALNITTGQDNSGNGLNAQRPNQMSDDVYGAKTAVAYLNRAAFAQPAPGTFGDLPINAVKGPARWTIDVALSRNINLTRTQSVELRLESFNLLNHVNLGNPNTNLNLGNFGRITALQTGTTPRILQFGLKYGF